MHSIYFVLLAKQYKIGENLIEITSVVSMKMDHKLSHTDTYSRKQ